MWNFNQQSFENKWQMISLIFTAIGSLGYTFYRNSLLNEERLKNNIDNVSELKECMINIRNTQERLAEKSIIILKSQENTDSYTLISSVSSVLGILVFVSLIGVLLWYQKDYTEWFQVITRNSTTSANSMSKLSDTVTDLTKGLDKLHDDIVLNNKAINILSQNSSGADIELITSNVEALLEKHVSLINKNNEIIMQALQNISMKLDNKIVQAGAEMVIQNSDHANFGVTAIPDILTPILG